eukprot:TRINITY_DN15588_c0_g1_i5.p1 TRINITY_DN15588_c0_g1~~TRINITY_DN15588_c0_g1_i5.p1  ORF type:complete len:441 (+),score=70.47 TRINITY_DN15588_c0_g1_i5:236-1558(+)
MCLDEGVRSTRPRRLPRRRAWRNSRCLSAVVCLTGAFASSFCAARAGSTFVVSPGRTAHKEGGGRGDFRSLSRISSASSGSSVEGRERPGRGALLEVEVAGPAIVMNAAKTQKALSAAAESLAPASEHLPFAAQLDEELQKPTALLFQASLVLIAVFISMIGTLKLDPSTSSILSRVEEVVQGCLVVEYLLRWYSQNLRPAYLFEPNMVIDLLAFLPLLVSLLPGDHNPLFPTDLKFLRAIRILSLERFLNDRKFLIQLLGNNVSALGLELTIAFGNLFTLLVIFSGFFYVAEKADNPGVTNFFSAMYFMLVTVSTVGFGDIVPVTDVGHIVVAFAIVIGVGLFPLLLQRILESMQNGTATPVQPATKEDMSQIVRKLAEQQQSMDAIRKSLEEGDRDRVLAIEGSPTATAAACASCSTAGHRADAIFCYRCGARLAARR